MPGWLLCRVHEPVWHRRHAGMAGCCPDNRPMIPLSDDNPARRRPYVTWLLLALCSLVFLWQLSLGNEVDLAIALFGFTPVGMFDPALAPSLVLGIPPSVTLITSQFLHGGWLHLGSNLLYLWIFGNNVEDALGHGRYLLFYLLCGVAAALSMLVFHHDSTMPMIGASGAISGILAAYVLLYPRARVLVMLPVIFYPVRIMAYWVLGFWFVLQVISAVATPPDAPGIAWWAHIGGFLAGGLLLLLFKPRHVPFFGDIQRDIQRGPSG